LASRDSELTKIRDMMSSDEAKWMEWNAKVAKLKELAPPGAKSILLRITGAAEAQKEARAESVRQASKEARAESVRQASAPLLAKIAAGRARTEAREKELARVAAAKAAAAEEAREEELARVAAAEKAGAEKTREEELARVEVYERGGGSGEGSKGRVGESCGGRDRGC